MQKSSMEKWENHAFLWNQWSPTHLCSGIKFDDVPQFQRSEYEVYRAGRRKTGNWLSCPGCALQNQIPCLRIASQRIDRLQRVKKASKEVHGWRRWRWVPTHLLNFRYNGCVNTGFLTYRRNFDGLDDHNHGNIAIIGCNGHNLSVPRYSL